MKIFLKIKEFLKNNVKIWVLVLSALAGWLIGLLFINANEIFEFIVNTEQIGYIIMAFAVVMYLILFFKLFLMRVIMYLHLIRENNIMLIKLLEEKKNKG